MHYDLRGHGPAVLVPSAIGARPYQRQLPAALDEHFTMVFVELRAEPLDFDGFADDFEAVRRAIGAERVAILGHSVLGMLAIEYARRRPERVSRAIAVGTPPRGDMRALQARSSAFFAERASAERKQILADNLARLPAGAPPAQAVLAQTPLRFFDPRFDAAPLFAEATPSPALLQHLLGTLAPSWDVTAGPPLAVPLALAHGRHDYTVPHPLWDDVLPRLPTARLEIFEQSGHQPFVEEPERFVAWMRA
jgi:proline iminopeptidase